MSDSQVRLNIEGTGPRVATEAITTPQGVDTSGNAQADLTRHTQVVAIADDSGSTIDDPNALLAELVAAQRRTNELLELVLGALG